METTNIALTLAIRQMLHYCIHHTQPQASMTNRSAEFKFCTLSFYGVEYSIKDRLFCVAVSTSDCHPRGPGFDSRLYPRHFFLDVQGLERGSPSLVRAIGQLLDMRRSEIWLRKLKLMLRDNALLTTKSPVLPSGSNHFSRSWLFGAVPPWI